MKKGFTLIELLIVVAIIAILAAIAVPNFLEAQTRAKVARSKADMRSIAVAIESYVVDYNVVPLDGDDNNAGSPVPFRTTTPAEVGRDSDIFPSCTTGEGPNSLRGRPYNFRVYQVWKMMTSPIAYMTGIYIEPYSQFIPYGRYDQVSNANPPAYCMLISCGPDKTISNDSSHMGDLVPADTNTGFGGRLISGFPTITSNLAKTLNNVYDPSNGTISYGEVYRLSAVRNIDDFYSFSTANQNGHGYGFPLTN